MINAKRTIRTLGCWGIGCCLFTVYLLQYMHTLNLRTAFILNLSFILLLVIFLFIISWEHIWPKPLFENKKQWILFLLVVAIGVLARIFRWDLFPVQEGQLVEEAQTGGIAHFMPGHSGIDIYFPIVNVLAEIGLKIFGPSMNGLRLPFLGWGILSVPIFFIGARLCFRTFSAALGSSLLFASCAFLAGSSRIAMETMSPVTTLTIALTATIYACSRKQYPAFCTAGFAIGLLLLEYVSFKLVAVMLAVFLFLHFLRKQEQGDTRRLPEKSTASVSLARKVLQAIRSLTALYRVKHILPYSKHFLLLFICILLILMPVLLSGTNTFRKAFFENIGRHKADLADRSLQQTTWQSIVNQQFVKVKTVASFVFLKGEDNDVLPNTQGIIEFFTGIVGLVAGLYCLVFALESPVKMFVVGTILLTIFGAGFFVVNPSRYRLIPIIPLWCLMIGIGVDDLLGDILKHRRTIITGCAVGFISLAGLNLYSFFGVAIDHQAVQRRFDDINLVLAQQFATIQKDDDQATIYLFSDKTFLGIFNDYGFLYDYDRVHVVQSFDEVIGKQGYFLTHDHFIAKVKPDMEHLSNCKQWQVTHGTHEVLRCQLGS